MEDIKIDGLSADEWEQLANPQAPTNEQLGELGIVQEDSPAQEHSQKAERQDYEKLGYWQTVGDEAMAGLTEASKFFLPKSKELNYTPRTKAGEAFQTFSKYLYGLGGLLVGGEVAGAAKGAALANNLSGAAKVAGFAESVLKGNKFFKTSATGAKALGVKALNIGTQGVMQGAILDATIRDTDEGRLADFFGETNNKFIDWLQTDENDTTAQAKLKNVVDGALFSIGINGVISAAEPILGRVLTNIKKVKNSKLSQAEIQTATEEIAKDQQKLEKISETSDLVDTVKNIREQAIESGDDASQAIIDTLHPSNIEEGQRALRMLDEGNDIFVHEDGTFDIKIDKWDDAYKVAPEEYKKQLAAQDMMSAESGINVRAGDTALQHQDEAVRHTWTNRGWIGENEQLTQSNANKVAKNYKDKFEIDNNVKVEFVDGLKVKGQAVDGNTSATKFLGKNKKTTKASQTKIDKKNLEIQQLQDKITQLEGGNGEVSDPLDVLKEKLRIAQNELKDLEQIPQPKKNPDITIKIDKNAKNPYATLRSELEHARDIAKGEVPKEEGKHFARYNGANEGEVAGDYVYKKSVGKNKALSEQQAVDTITANNQANIENGYKFKESPTDTFSGEGTRIEMTNPEGNKVAHLDYSVDGDTLHIEQITNLSHNTEYYERGTAEKLVDNIISKHPDKNIQWDATTSQGMRFKKQYLESHPELQGKTKGISTQEELDLSIENDYNAREEVLDEGSNRDNRQFSLESRAGENQAANQTEGRFNSSAESHNDSIGDTLPSNSSTNARGKNTSIGNEAEQLKLNFSEVKTSEELVDNVTNGTVKLTSPEDVKATVGKTIELDPEISGTTWADIAKDSDKIADWMLEAERLGCVDELKEAMSISDVDKMDIITRKVLAAQRLKSNLAENLATLGENPPIEQKKAIIDLIDQIQRYTKETGSASGRSLEARKLINKGIESFGTLRLSQLTKEGIETISDMLAKEIEKIELNFTRGKVLTPLEKKQALMESVLQNPDSPFVQLLTEDEKIAAKFDGILDDLFKHNEKITIDKIYDKLETAITEANYEAVYEATKLTNKPKNKIDVITNWVDKQGGYTSYYVHNLLSGVGTLAKNVISGGMNTLYFPAKKIIAGYCFGGGEAMAREGWNTYKNLMSNWRESWDLCKQAFLTGDGQLSMMKDTMALADNEKFNGFREFNFDDTSPQGIWYSIQNIHSIMTRAMGASDEFMSQLNYRSIMRAKSLERAENIAKQFNITDENTINNMADIAFSKAFDEAGKPLDVSAFAEAKDILYQLPLNGQMFDNKTGEMVAVRGKSLATKFGQGINSGAASNGFLKVMFPFVKTGVNILQQNLEHNGLYAAFSPTQRQLLKSNTREGALARSQVAFGAFSFMVAGGLAISGHITGSAPSDPKERKALFDTGWKPYSIRIGDKYVSYQGYEPLQTILGFGADCINIGANIFNKEDEAKWDKLTQQVLSTAVNNFLDKAAFRTGLRQLDLVMNPQDIDEWKKSMAQTVQGFLPDSSMVKGVSSLGKRNLTSPNTPYERIVNNYFNRGLGDYRRDVFGNRQDNYGLLVTNVTPDKGSNVEYQELENLAQFGFNPSEISKTIQGTTLKYRDFKDSQTGRSAYDAMQEELSTVEINGKTLQEAVADLVESDEYQNLPIGVNMNGFKFSSSEATKLNAMRDVFVEYNTAALNNVIREQGDDFIDKKGRTMSEAKEETEVQKLDASINQGLDHNLSNQLRRF